MRNLNLSLGRRDADAADFNDTRAVSRRGVSSHAVLPHAVARRGVAPRAVARIERLRRRSRDEGAFTLIELLVVILIIGILAAIAIPAFLSQKGKAVDASAKALVNTAETTAETYGTDHNGEYGGLTAPSALVAYEKSIQTSAGKGEAYLNKAKEIETGGGFEVAATATNGAEYTIKKKANGTVERLCNTTAETTKGGCLSGTWSS